MDIYHSLFIHLSLDIWPVSTFWLWWKILTWTWVCKFLCKCTFQLSWNLGVKLLSHMVSTCLTIQNHPCFPAQSEFLPQPGVSSSRPPCRQHPSFSGVLSIFCFSHFHQCAVVSHGGCNSHFIITSDGENPFMGFASHIYILWGCVS